MPPSPPQPPAASLPLCRTDSPWRERRFISACLTGFLGARLTGQLAAPGTEGLDWPLVCTEAEKHGVGPLLRAALGEKPPSCPPPIWDRLVEQTDRTARLNGLALIRLNELLSGFAAAGLTAPVLLKGASLLQTVYPQIGLRPMQDLDLLLDREQRARAVAVIEAAGYRQDRPPAPSPWHALVLEEGHHRVTFTPPDTPGNLPLECHLRLLEWPDAGSARLWERARLVDAGSAPCRLLHPVDELLFLALHLARHQRPDVGGAGRLVWWFDVAARLQRLEAPADEIATRLSDLPPQRQEEVRQVLAVVRELFAVAVSSDLAPPLQARHLRQQSLRLWEAASNPVTDLPWLWNFFENSPRLASPWSKLRFVAGYLFPPPAYVRRRHGLSRPLSLIRWYAARPLGLACKLVRVLLRR